MKTKKLLLKIFLPLTLVLVFLFNLTACSEDRFMNDNELLNVDTLNGSISLRVNANGAYWQTFEIPFVLEYKKAPITVTNFVYLIQTGYYNYEKFSENLAAKTEAEKVKPIMHRLEKSSNFFILQGGGYKTNIEDTSDIVELTAGGLNYSIKGEFKDNGWNKNDISHKAGVLSMARQSGYDTASSEFFITLGDCSSSLDNKYAAFGYIVEGGVDGKLLTILKDMSTSSEKFSFSSSYFNNYPKYKIEIVKLEVNTSITFPKSLQIAK